MTAVTLETVAAAEARAAATLAAAEDYADGVAGGGGGNAHWAHQVLPWVNWKGSSGTVTRTLSNTRLGCGYITLPNTTGSWVEFSVPLDAGTWTITLIYDKLSTYGNTAVKVDGTTAATVDQYAASSTTNQVAEITGVVVASSGNHTVRLENSSAGTGGGYVVQATALGFQRTA